MTPEEFADKMVELVEAAWDEQGLTPEERDARITKMEARLNAKRDEA